MKKSDQTHLVENKKELSKQELKAIRQQVKNTMNPEGLNHLWFYFEVIQPPKDETLSNQIFNFASIYNELKAIIKQSVKGINYIEDFTDGVTYHAELIYNDNGEELLRPWLTSKDNTITVILFCLRVNIISKLRAFLSGFRDSNKQNKAKPIRISTAVIQNIAPIKKQNLDLNDSLLPKTIISEIKQQGLIEWHNQNGQGFNLSPFYWDIILAIVEINASKSETQNENSPNFYLGNATEINRQGEKTAHVTASLYEIAKTVYGGTKPGGKDQTKIEEALKDISTNPKLRPLLIYPVYDNTTTDSKGKTKRVQRTITTYKPILEIFSLNETTTIDGGKPKQTNEILIRLNEIFVQDIKGRFVELRGDYLLQRNILSKTLGARPQMLNDFYLLIRNAWGYRHKMDKDAEGRPVFIIGLLKNTKGEPGLFYKLGYANYEKNGNKKRFELAYNKSIEYLKGGGDILEYAVTKDEWGHENAMFILPPKTKKSRVIDE
jgi:hypothetical protein